MTKTIANADSLPPPIKSLNRFSSPDYIDRGVGAGQYTALSTRGVVNYLIINWGTQIANYCCNHNFFFDN